MNFKLPTIQKTKQADEEDYNFVNTKERRKTRDLTPSPLNLIDDLKRKVQDQRREIETRNNAIMAIQRNFESMAALLKTEKAEANQLRQDSEKLKRSSDDNAKRVVDFQERNIQLQTQLKKLQAEGVRLAEDNQGMARLVGSAQKQQRAISDLQAQNKRLRLNIQQLQCDLEGLKNRLGHLKDAQKEQRGLRVVIVNLEEELQQSSTQRNSLTMCVQQAQDQNKVLDATIKRLQDHIQTLRKKGLDEKSRQASSNDQLSKMRHRLAVLQDQNSRNKAEAENKDVIIMMKIKTEEQLKNSIVDLKLKIDKVNGQLYLKTSELDDRVKHSLILEDQVRSITQRLQATSSKNGDLQADIAKASLKDSEVQEGLRELTRLHQRVVSLQGATERDQAQIRCLECVVVKYQPYFAQLDKYSVAKVVDPGEYATMQRLLEEGENEKAHLISQNQRLNSDICRQIQEAKRTSQLLQEYSTKEEDLKKILDLQEAKMVRLQTEKSQKEKEVERERQNNRLLWSDNKKLKEKERLLEELEATNKDIILQSQKDLDSMERQKAEQLARQTSRLRTEYEKQFQLMSNSTTDQLSVLLRLKAEAVQSLEQKLEKLARQLEFYRNRNQELEGVASRSQRKITEMQDTLEQNLATRSEQHSRLSAEHKQCDQSIKSLTDRLSSLQAFKRQHSNLEEQRGSMQAKVATLTTQNQEMRRKLGVFESEDYLKKRRLVDQKVLLLLKSVGDLQESLIAIKNHISCAHCCELPVDSVKLVPCGHVYCKKCKEGYETLCEECKRSGDPMPDKQHDQTVAKLNYMQMILVSVKEDTEVLGKL